jgi:hypothetical protein
MKTEVEITEFKGAPLLQIWEIDEEGKRKPFPIVAFGLKKAKAIVKHIEDIEAFTEEKK